MFTPKWELNIIRCHISPPYASFIPSDVFRMYRWSGLNGGFAGFLTRRTRDLRPKMWCSWAQQVTRCNRWKQWATAGGRGTGAKALTARAGTGARAASLGMATTCGCPCRCPSGGRASRVGEAPGATDPGGIFWPAQRARKKLRNWLGIAMFDCQVHQKLEAERPNKRTRSWIGELILGNLRGSITVPALHLVHCNSHGCINLVILSTRAHWTRSDKASQMIVGRGFLGLRGSCFQK